MNTLRRGAVAALLAGAIAASPTFAIAGDHDHHRDRREHRDDRDVQAVPRREAREEYREWRRDDRRVVRVEPRYDASRYYQYDERRYPARPLGANDRIYRGLDDRYYCRHSDGTTGLIIGGVAGGVLGNVIAPGDSKTLGTLIGAGGGALLGRAIDQKRVICK